MTFQRFLHRHQQISDKLQRELNILGNLWDFAIRSILKIRPRGALAKAGDCSRLNAAPHNFVGGHVGMRDETGHAAPPSDSTLPITRTCSLTNVPGG